MNEGEHLLWMPAVVQVFLFFAVPAVLLAAADRVRIVQWLSPAFFCYLGGIIMALIPGFTVSATLVEPITSGTVVLAIPLMLFSTRMRSLLRMAPKLALSMGLWTLAVAGSASMATYLFRDVLAGVGDLGGMAAGVYIGGTANMAAIRLARGVAESVFLQMNLADMIVSAVFLLFLLTLAQKVLLRVLPAYQPQALTDAAMELPTPDLPSGEKWLVILKGIGASLLVGALAAGISWGLLGSLSDAWVIVLITIGGLLGSLLPGVRRLSLTYETGEYLFLVFCVAIGARVEIGAFLENSGPILGLMACTLYGGVTFHLLLARSFRIDADTAIITAAAGAFGPPFIGPVANALQNREIVAAGMTLGVAGLAIGNFIGLLLSWFWNGIL